MYKKIDWWFILMACMGLSLQAFPQSGQVGTKGYYVVINAYAESREDMAILYYKKISDEGEEAHYAFMPSKRMYFVYTKFSKDYTRALGHMRTARQDPRFPDAWVYVSDEEQKAVPDQTLEPNISENRIEPDHEGEPKENSNAGSNLVASVQKGQLDMKAMEELDTHLEPPANVKELVFVLSNARNHKEVRGDVQIIDTERAKRIGIQNSGEIKALEDPRNGSGKLTFICDVFGYRKSQMEVNYLGLDEHEDIQQLADYYVIFFDLVRYHKGDIATMYNVYYYKDAAIMRPESKYEVNSLLEMMRENPDYRIRIHGHTNGNRRGKIISQGDSDNFFGLNDGNHEGNGSAKQLSRLRAEVIRDYLISQGVDAGRMEIKAWGGRRMLYDKNSSNAGKNVRVEIEILEE